MYASELAALIERERLRVLAFINDDDRRMHAMRAHWEGYLSALSWIERVLERKAKG